MKMFFLSCILFSFVQMAQAQVNDTSYVISNGKVVQKITITRNMVSVDSLSDEDKDHVIQSFKTGVRAFYDTVVKMRSFPKSLILGDKFVKVTSVAIHTGADGQAIAVPQYEMIYVSNAVNYAVVFSVIVMVLACIFWFFYAKYRHKKKPLPKDAILPHGISIEKSDSLFPVFMIALSLSAIADVVGMGILQRIYDNSTRESVSSFLPVLIVQVLLFTVIEQILQNKHARVKK